MQCWLFLTTTCPHRWFYYIVVAPWAMLTLPSDPSHRNGGILKMVHCKLYTNFDTLGIDYPQEYTVSNNRQGDNHIQCSPAGIFHCCRVEVEQHIQHAQYFNNDWGDSGEKRKARGVMAGYGAAQNESINRTWNNMKTAGTWSGHAVAAATAAWHLRY